MNDSLKIEAEEESTIEDIRNLVSTHSGTHINLSSRCIKNIQNLPVRLTHLNISSNRLTTMKSFNNMVNIIRIDASYNLITTTEGISIPSLEQLDLSHNKISNIKHIEKCRNLSSINLNNNCIKTLRFLAGSSNVLEVSPLDKRT